jgi:hypothetical protein
MSLFTVKKLSSHGPNSLPGSCQKQIRHTTATAALGVAARKRAKLSRDRQGVAASRGRNPEIENLSVNLQANNSDSGPIGRGQHFLAVEH